MASSTDRQPLTRERIVAEAVALADAEGIDGLSMRRLAGSLGYEPMSLYNHVDGKDDLLARMFEHVIKDVPLPDDDEHWRSALTALAVRTRDVLLEHPWSCDVWGAAMPGPALKHWMEALLRSVRRGGFSRRLAHHALHAINLHVLGYVRDQIAFTLPGDDPEAVLRRFIAETPREDYPFVREHVDHHVQDTGEEDDFVFLLDLVLDGLERHHDS